MFNLLVSVSISHKLLVGVSALGISQRRQNPKNEKLEVFSVLIIRGIKKYKCALTVRITVFGTFSCALFGICRRLFFGRFCCRRSLQISRCFARSAFSTWFFLHSLKVRKRLIEFVHEFQVKILFCLNLIFYTVLIYLYIRYKLIQFNDCVSLFSIFPRK